MAKLLLMRNTPMPLRAIVQILRARLQSRVEGQGQAASQAQGGQDDVEGQRAHAARPVKSPRTAGGFGPGLPSAVGGPLAAGAGEAPAKLVGGLAGQQAGGCSTGAPNAPAPREMVAGLCSLFAQANGVEDQRPRSPNGNTSIALLPSPSWRRAFSRMGK